MIHIIYRYILIYFYVQTYEYIYIWPSCNACNTPDLPAKELDPSCRQVIMDNHRWVQEWTDHKYLQPHVFDDVKAQLPCSLDESASFKKRKIQCEQCGFKKKAFCHVHNKECSLEDPSDINISGLPCQDNSRANLKRKFFVKGQHGSVYLVWARKHRLARTPLLVLENTPETRFGA